MNDEQTLRILVTREGNLFVAQCLEYDICTSAHSMSLLQDRMNDLIAVELNFTSESGQAIDPAPERFHKMWDSAVAQTDGDHEYRLAA